MHAVYYTQYTVYYQLSYCYRVTAHHDHSLMPMLTMFVTIQIINGSMISPQITNTPTHILRALCYNWCTRYTYVGIGILLSV